MRGNVEHDTTTGRKSLNEVRAAFMQRIAAPSIPPHALKLAYLIAFKYLNRQTWTARPAQDTLAADLNVSVRTVQRLLDILEPLGLTVVPGDGRGRASTYSIDPERATRVSSFEAQKGDKKGRHPTTKKGDTGVAPTKKKNQEADQDRCFTTVPDLPGERASPLAARAGEDDIPSAPRARLDGGAGAEEGAAVAAPEFAGTEAPPAPAESKQAPRSERHALGTDRTATAGREAGVFRAVRKTDAEPIDNDWRALHALWRRGHLSDDTAKALASERRAYARACASTAPAEISAGAQRWIEAADAPRFLPPLATWLDAQGWTKPPPKKPKQAHASGHGNGNGNGNGGHQQRPYRRRPTCTDFAEEMMIAGGAVRGENGALYYPDERPVS
jgi:hypothetical protein